MMLDIFHNNFSRKAEWLSRMPRGGTKGALIPGPQGLEGPFRYQNGYYLSVM